MASYNRVIIVGNLTRDPELRQLSSGQTICRFGIASNRQYKNKQTGALVNEVCFVDVDVWGPQGENCNQYLQKGKLALVEGRLKFDSWEDAEGNKRSKHSVTAERVTFLSFAAAQENSEVPFKQPDNSSSDVKTSSSDVETSTKSSSNKEAKTSKKTKKSKSSDKEVNFKNEQPFEDELPF